MAQTEADQAEKELTTYNNKRFDMLRDYLSAESDNSAHLQHVIDLMSRDTVGEPRQLIADISETSSRATRLLADYDRLQ